MREPCDAFGEARDIEPDLKACPVREIKVIRPLSGHGGKVCDTCRKKNRDEQRKRENAQKRARRAKLKKDKMTAGMGAGNVVWVPPHVWSPSVVDTPDTCKPSVMNTPAFVDAHTLALHSPRPRRLNTFNVRSVTKAVQCGLNGSISTATMEENHVSFSKHERGVESQSRQLFVATMSKVLQPEGNGHDKITNEIRDDAKLDDHLSTNSLDFPLYQEEKCEQVGLGITMADDAKWWQSHTETCFSSEGSFRMEPEGLELREELEKWSHVFEDDHDSDDGKELW